MQYTVQKCNCDVLLAVCLHKKVSATWGMPQTTNHVHGQHNKLIPSFALSDGPEFAISEAVLVASNSAIADIYIMYQGPCRKCEFVGCNLRVSRII